MKYRVVCPPLSPRTGRGRWRIGPGRSDSGSFWRDTYLWLVGKHSNVSVSSGSFFYGKSESYCLSPFWAPRLWQTRSMAVPRATALACSWPTLDPNAASSRLKTRNCCFWSGTCATLAAENSDPSTDVKNCSIASC